MGAWGNTLADLWQAKGHQLTTWSRRLGGDPAVALPGAGLCTALTLGKIAGDSAAAIASPT
jgi:hypothetical protein